jgi:hypothetical protein
MKPGGSIRPIIWMSLIVGIMALVAAPLDFNIAFPLGIVVMALGLVALLTSKPYDEDDEE